MMVIQSGKSPAHSVLIQARQMPRRSIARQHYSGTQSNTPGSFSVPRRGVQCMNGKTFSNLISALNPALGEAYRRERWHSATTGKGHDCRAPQGIVGVSTSSMG